jgi:hypothetical protein
MRLLAFIFILFAMLAPFWTNISVAFPTTFPDKIYFAAFSVTALIFALLSRIPALNSKKENGRSNAALPSKTNPAHLRWTLQKPRWFGVLSASVLLWAMISAIRGDFMFLAFAAFFFALVLTIRHDEEWVRLSRLLVVAVALSAWMITVGLSLVKPLLGVNIPIFVPALFLAMVLLLRSKEERRARLIYTLVAVWILIIILLITYPWQPISLADEIIFWKMIWNDIRADIVPFAFLAIMWASCFTAIIRMYIRRTATTLWVAGLFGALLGLFLVDPLLIGAGVGSGMMFVFIAGLAEWVSHNEA